MLFAIIILKLRTKAAKPFTLPIFPLSCRDLKPRVDFEACSAIFVHRSECDMGRVTKLLSGRVVET